MSDDNSPMLSQPSDDNAPMISGRGTKIIADARGAYLAGNLNHLVEWMREDQRLRFHQEIVRGAILHLRATLQCEDASPRTPEFIEAAERWLTNPTSQTVEVLLELEVAELNNSQQYSAPELILDSFAWCVVSSSPAEAADWACGVSRISAIMQFQDELTQSVVDGLTERNNERIEHWHLELAWAILRGAALLPLPALITTVGMQDD